MYEIVRGPLAWCAFMVCFLGMAFQITRLFVYSRSQPRTRLALQSAYFNNNKNRSFRDKWIARLAAWRLTLWGVDPLMAGCSSLFHLCVFILPIFLLQHNSIMGELWGVTLCPHVLSDIQTDFLCSVVFACGAVFLIRRIFVRKVRAITTLYDYLIWAIALGPFVTGFLAIHNVFDYKTLVVCHILSAETLLVAAPFTKFFHMMMFFFNRIFLAGELSFGAGRRVWK
jgi:hypothetical protein